MTAWPQVFVTSTIQGSPIAAAAETVIATLPVTTDGAVAIALFGFITATIGTTGNSMRLVIRADSVTGTVLADSSAVSVTAGQLLPFVVGQVATLGEIAARSLVMTAKVNAATAPTTIASMLLLAIPQF